MQLQSAKPHAVLLASPGMGHLIPVLELGKRLVTHHGFDVTIFVVTTDALLSKSQLLKTSHSSKMLNIVLLPPVDISAPIESTTSILTQLAIMMRMVLPSLRKEISTIKHRPTALIVDLFGTEAFVVADEFEMKKYVFITSTAWFLALTIHVPTLDTAAEDDHVINQKPLLIPGCKPLRFEDTFVDRDDETYTEYRRMGVEIPMANGILVNTWQELETATLSSLFDKKKLGRVTGVPVYPIGPLVRQVEPGSRSDVLAWLDMQPNKSVIYVSFGSGGTLSAMQTIELAWGLELSHMRFIWVLRPPVENDAAGSALKLANTSDDSPDYLPHGFLTRTDNMGLVVPMWAQQTEILGHPSIGGFLSHCGWNSTLESIVNGVPMIAWPLYAEQKMNATMLTEDIEVAIRSKALPTNQVIGRDEIATMIRTIMENNDGNPIRTRVESIKTSAKNALSKGGSSYNSLSKVANDCDTSLPFTMEKALGA